MICLRIGDEKENCARLRQVLLKCDGECEEKLLKTLAIDELIDVEG